MWRNAETDWCVIFYMNHYAGYYGKQIFGPQMDRIFQSLCDPHTHLEPFASPPQRGAYSALLTRLAPSFSLIEDKTRNCVQNSVLTDPLQFAQLSVKIAVDFFAHGLLSSGG
ncbi:unnamed protein product, partial [Sphacelaria rigidula]